MRRLFFRIIDSPQRHLKLKEFANIPGIYPTRGILLFIKNFVRFTKRSRILESLIVSVLKDIVLRVEIC